MVAVLGKKTPEVCGDSKPKSKELHTKSICHGSKTPIKLESKTIINSKYITSWWFQPLWKILVKLDHFPSRGENKTCLKPPPRWSYRFMADWPGRVGVEDMLLSTNFFPTNIPALAGSSSATVHQMLHWELNINTSPNSELETKTRQFWLVGKKDKSWLLLHPEMTGTSFMKDLMTKTL